MERTKTALLIALVVILLALDWAALHDILKGESDPYLEYGMVVFSLIVFGLVIYGWSRKRRQKENIV